MRLVRFSAGGGEPRRGVLEDETVVAVAGDFLGEWRRTDARYPLSEVRLLAPIVPPNMPALAGTYREHCAEEGKAPPKAPVLFSKLTTCLNDPGGTVVLPRVSAEVDYEAELVVIIGRTARNVTRETALDHVLGYTCGLDVSARDCQRADGQFVRAKSFDTFGPIGPWIETELDPADLAIRLRLNGKTLQDARTSQLIFDVAEIVRFLSQDTTLLPGTAIFTGTPSGVGVARKPPVFLKSGDRVEVEIEGIGILTNGIEAPSA